MGELTNMISEGTVCKCCGMPIETTDGPDSFGMYHLKSGPGHPRYCSKCKPKKKRRKSMASRMRYVIRRFDTGKHIYDRAAVFEAVEKGFFTYEENDEDLKITDISEEGKKFLEERCE